MTISNELKEHIIEGFLLAKPFREISKENGVSIGSISNYISAWNSEIKDSSINHIREFYNIVRKSGMTVEECSQGFRFGQILSKFEVSEKSDKDFSFNSLDPNTIKSIHKRKEENLMFSKDNMYYFIMELYVFCKNQGIKPSDLIKLMQDILEFHSNYLNNDKNTYINSRLTHEKFTNNHSTNINTSFTHKDDNNIKSEKNHMPFISTINNYLEQKKTETIKYTNTKKKVLEEVKALNDQKNILENKIEQLEDTHNEIISYILLFNDLSKELLKVHKIKLKDEIKNFAKAINDFKSLNYNPYKIIKEYNKLETLKSENEFIKDINKEAHRIKDILLNEVANLNEQKNHISQTMNIYYELSHLGFDLKGLKNLRNIIVEISKANDISSYEAIQKFIKDLNEYDTKLGFEKKANELKSKINSPPKEETENRWNSSLKEVVGIVLKQLYASGVTDEDIININQLFSSYINENFILDPNAILYQKITKQHNTDFIDRTKYWKNFINELKSLGNINFQVYRQQVHLINIMAEIDKANIQRLKLNRQILMLINTFSSLYPQLLHLSEILKQMIIFSPEINRIITIHFPLFYVFTENKSNQENSKKKSENKTDITKV